MTSEIISSIYVEVEVEEGEDRMKKVLSVLLILALVFGLAACGGGETAEEPAGDEVVIVPSLQDEAEIQQRFPKGYNAIRPYLRLTPDPRPQ